MLNYQDWLRAAAEYTRLYVVHDAATFLLALTVAYLVHGILHLVTELLTKKESTKLRWVVITCRVLVFVTIWAIAGIHAAEYMSTRPVP